MKKLVSSLVQAFFALSALSLLGALVIPWRDPPPLAAARGAPALIPADPPNADTARGSRSPEEVLSLFGKRDNPGRAPAVPPHPGKPVDAPWLLYLGYYDSSPDGPSYLLKDTRSGRLIAAAAQGAAAQGWSVVAVEENIIVVRNESDLFIVRKR